MQQRVIVREAQVHSLSIHISHGGSALPATITIPTAAAGLPRKIPLIDTVWWPPQKKAGWPEG